MKIETCKKADFDQILADIADFWGSDRTFQFHHPIFINEFADTAFVIREGDKVTAYLFGFFSQAEKTGYVHLIGVRTNFQKRGLGKKLYEHFIAVAKAAGCEKIKAITTPGNQDSIDFHRKIGMNLLGTENENGVKVVKNYSGPGLDRVIFEKYI
jgi:GNAT superfamily N-acetyltransferase